MHYGTRIVTESSSQRDHAEFLRLFSACHSEIKRTLIVFVANKHDAEDLLQDVSVILWERFDEFDRTRSFAAWATGIALNKARQFLRNRSRRRSWTLSEESIANLLKARTGAAELLELRYEKLEECLSEVSSKERKMLWDCYGDDIQITLWAKTYQRPEGTVRSLLHRLRQRLFECVNRKLSRQEGGLK